MGKAKPEAVKLARDFKEKAKQKYNIYKIILFGSQVTGDARKGSDIDLLIVSDKFKSRAAFMSELFREWHLVQKKNMPVDFICFTQKEFNKLANEISIVKQALEEGIEI